MTELTKQEAVDLVGIVLGSADPFRVESRDSLFAKGLLDSKDKPATCISHIWLTDEGYTAATRELDIIRPMEHPSIQAIIAFGEHGDDAPDPQPIITETPTDEFIKILNEREMAWRKAHPEESRQIEENLVILAMELKDQLAAVTAERDALQIQLDMMGSLANSNASEAARYRVALERIIELKVDTGLSDMGRLIHAIQYADRALNPSVE